MSLADLSAERRMNESGGEKMLKGKRGGRARSAPAISYSFLDFMANGRGWGQGRGSLCGGKDWIPCVKTIRWQQVSSRRTANGINAEHGGNLRHPAREGSYAVESGRIKRPPPLATSPHFGHKPSL